jgi:periplasmic divalent cation tolerance protein
MHNNGEPLVSGLVEIRTTFASREAAVACADLLVRECLAACVQVEGPVTSTYSWKGAVEQAEEWRCTCKTTRAASDACIAGIVSGHEYDIPQVVVTQVDVTPAYAAWVESAVGPSCR